MTGFEDNESEARRSFSDTTAGNFEGGAGTGVSERAGVRLRNLWAVVSTRRT